MRALLYSPDTYGLGHIRRTLHLAGALARERDDAAILVVTGAPHPELFPKPPGADFARLPAVTKDRRGHYVPRRLRIPIDELVRLRSELALTAIRSFRPNLVVVDHAALGFRGELEPALHWLRGQHPRPHTVLGLRDVYDSPARSRAQLRSDGAIRAMRALYDEVLVFGHRHIYDYSQIADLPGDVSEKLRYVGFACSPAPDRPADAPSHGAPYRIVVCAGGGGDGYPLFRAAAAALREEFAAEPIAVDLITGPFLSSRKRDRILQLVDDDPRFTVERIAGDLTERFRTADLVISMAGANTVAEVLRAGARLLVCPRTHPRKEQMERASRLESLGLLRLFDPRDVERPDRLAAAIRDALARPLPQPARRGLRFDGAARAAAWLVHGRWKDARVQDAG
jgi:predicted glycosyltransferase